jgi:hypothetical protein
MVPVFSQTTFRAKKIRIETIHTPEFWIESSPCGGAGGTPIMRDTALSLQAQEFRQVGVNTGDELLERRVLLPMNTTPTSQ